LTAIIHATHNFRLNSSTSKDTLKVISSKSSSDQKRLIIKPSSVKQIQKLVRVGRKIPHLSASAKDLVRKMSKPVNSDLNSVKTEESSIAEEMPFGAEEFPSKFVKKPLNVASITIYNNFVNSSNSRTNKLEVLNQTRAKLISNSAWITSDLPSRNLPRHNLTADC
jgi:hypothetical protein